MLYHPRTDRKGEVICIEKSGRLLLTCGGLSWNEHVENVEPVREFQVGDRVRQIGPSRYGFIDNMGALGEIEKKYPSGVFGIRWDNGHGNAMLPISIELVSCAPPAHPAIYVYDFQPFGRSCKSPRVSGSDRLLLSQAARRVIEFITAMDTPIALWYILEEMKEVMLRADIIDGLIEAREAGKICLEKGKYSLVRN